jgi:hypothetical protein
MKIILCLLFLLFSNVILSQHQGIQNHEEYMKKVLNSSQKPNSFTFNDYSKEGNVDISTGKFGITIPFTTIENQFISLPINLAYSTSGVKVAENASEIGIGWDLIAGGQITRKLNGKADDVNSGNSQGNLYLKRSPIEDTYNLGCGWTTHCSPLSLTRKSNGSARRLFDDTFEGDMTSIQGYNEFYSKYYPLPRKSASTTLFSDYQMRSIGDMLYNTAGVETQKDIFHVSVGELNFSFIVKLRDELISQIDETHKGKLNLSSILGGESNYVAVPLDDDDIKIDIIRGQAPYYYWWQPYQNTRIRSSIIDFYLGFIVTDKKGVKYYFENYLFTEPQHILSLMIHNSETPNYHRTIQGVMQDVQVNNWGLSKIIFPNNEIITYDYLKSRITEPKVVPREHDGQYTGFPHNLRPQITPDSYNSLDYEYEKLYINKITSRGRTVQFNYDSNLRSDLINGKRLKNIQLFDLNNHLVKQIDLISDYFGDNSANNYLSKRLFLNKIVEKSITNRSAFLYDENKNIVHEFEYYFPNNLPNKHASGFEDLYGYYLGNVEENTYPPFPKLYINPDPNAEGNKISYYPYPTNLPNTITIIGAERIPNELSVHYGALKKIKFPTRGSLIVEYEPNQFYCPSTLQTNLNGPGCRVKNLKYYTKQNFLAKNKQYKYESFDVSGRSSGILMYKPSYAFIANSVMNNSMNFGVEQTQQYDNNEGVLFENLVYKYSITKEVLNQNGINDLPTLYKKLITVSTHPIGPQYDYFGRDIIYTNVMEKEVSVEDENQNNGYIKYYNYYTDNRTEVNIASGPTTENTYIPPSSKDVMLSNDSGNDYGDMGSGGPPTSGGSYNIHPWQIDGCFGCRGGTKVKYGFVEKRGKDIFPFPERNYFGNNDALKIGKTYKTEYYNNINQKIKENNYNYLLLNNSTYKTLNFKIDYKDTYVHYADNINERYRNSSFFHAGLFFYTIDELYTKRKLVIEKEETIDYYNNELITNSTQNYFNSNFLINKISKKGSNQIIKEDLFYYPKDFNQGDDIIFFKSINRISEVIKNETRVSNQIVKSAINTFNLNSSATTNPYYVLNKSYSKKGDLNILALSDDDLKVTYDKYDSCGNLLQYTLKNGIPVTILWGYDKTLPIAKIENLTYAQVQSYESNLQTLSNAGNEINFINALNGLRNLFPSAMITTYTYSPLIGVSTITDAKGDIQYYDYNDFNQLIRIRDKNNNIMVETEYNYKTFENVEKSQVYFATICPTNAVAQSFNYVVPAGTYTAENQQAADAMAQNDIIANGQNFANNQIGACLFKNTTQFLNIYKNNCPEGTQATSYKYIVPEGTHTSYISQLVANNMALNDILLNAQNFANANGFCRVSDPFTLNPIFPFEYGIITGNPSNMFDTNVFTITVDASNTKVKLNFKIPIGTPTGDNGNPVWTSPNGIILGTLNSSMSRPNLNLNIPTSTTGGATWNITIATTGVISLKQTNTVNPYPSGGGGINFIDVTFDK